MDALYINVGTNSFISESDILMIGNPKTASIKKLVDAAKQNGNTIDCTSNKKMASVIIMKSGVYILSPIQASTLVARIEKKRNSLMSGYIDLKKATNGDKIAKEKFDYDYELPSVDPSINADYEENN